MNDSTTEASAKAGRIFWTLDEEDKLFDAAKIKYESGLKIVPALLAAQETVLPPSRRRHINAVQTLSARLRIRINLMRSSVAPPRAPAAAAPSALEAERVRADRLTERLDAVAAERDHLAARIAAAPRPDEVLGEFLVRALVDAGRRLLASPEALAFAENLNEGLAKFSVRYGGFLPEAAAPNGKRHDPSPQNDADRVRLPVIVVVGLKPAQRPPIESTFATRVRVKFWYDETSQALEAKAAGADFCFLMIDAVSHSARHTVEKSGCAYSLVPGGQSGLVAAIEAWIKHRPTSSK